MLPYWLDFTDALCKNSAVTTIDFHTHIFPPDVIARREFYLDRDGWFGQLYADPRAAMASADELVAALDASEIDQAVTFGFAWADPGLCRACNDYVLESMSRWPERLVGFAQVNPISEEAQLELERCMHQGFAGLGELMPDGQGYALDNPRLADVVQHMVHWRRPVLIHAGEPVGHSYPGKSICTLRPFYELAQRHPKALFVAAHWGGGLFFYELMPEVRQALGNVYYDTAASPYLYDDDIFAIAARIVPHKVLFATDYPLIPPDRFLPHVRGSGLSRTELADVLGNNAARLLRGEKLDNGAYSGLHRD